MPVSSPLADQLGNLPAIADLYALLHELRAAEPVAWYTPRQCWIVTSYELVQAALEDTRLSNRRTAVLVRAQVGEAKAPIAADFERIVSRMMLMHDGEEHHRLRTHGNRGLTPRVLERTRPRVERIAHELLDGCAVQQSFDLVPDFSQPYPSRVIAALFDLSPENRDLFQEPSEALARFFGATMRNPEADAVAANAAAVFLEHEFQKLLAERKRRPGDDLMSLFLAGQQEHQLTDEEICAQCMVLLAGGHVTTMSQVANALHALLSTPGLYRQLCRQPKLAEKAVEESLRYDSSVPFIFRLATEDVKLGGRTIATGEMVLLGLCAANRDPSVFADPDRFDLERPNKRNLAFGQGPHYCIGAGLARLELEVALTAISQRLPDLLLDPSRPAKRWRESMVFQGFESLPLVCSGGKI